MQKSHTFKYAALGLVTALGIALTPSGHAQRTYRSNLSVGARAGVTMSNVSFMPKVPESMLMGWTVGAVVRYTEEKHVGVIGEINISQRGWKESYDPGQDFSFSRSLTYINIPVMTHIYFGPKKFNCIINLGPEIAFMIANSAKANFDYNNINGVKGYPVNSRETAQMTMPIKNKIDYGITAGIGAEWKINPRNSVLIEARYYFGLGNLFDSDKKAVFSSSRPSSIEVTAGYMFRIK